MVELVAGAACAFSHVAVVFTHAAVPVLVAAEVVGTLNAVAAQLGLGHRRQGKHHGKPPYHLCLKFSFFFTLFVVGVVAWSNTLLPLYIGSPFIQYSRLGEYHFTVHF
jgi:hypothetical protein